MYDNLTTVLADCLAMATTQQYENRVNFMRTQVL